MRKAQGAVSPIGVKDQLLAELELDRTRAELEIEHLQQLRNELEHSRARLEALYKNGPVAYVTFDKKGVITEWNPNAAGLLDLRKRRLLNKPLSLFAVPDDRRILLEHIIRCRNSRGERVISELRLLNSRGPVPVQLVSVPFFNREARLFQTALIDLTERTKHERAVREAREFSDAIIQTVHEPLLVLDSSLRIVRMNEAFASLFRISPLLGKGVPIESVLNLWWSGNELRGKLEQAILRDVPITNFEFEASPGRLGRRVFLFNARRLLHCGSPHPMLLVALEDITARKDMEAQLARSNLQLQQLTGELERRVEERTRELSESNQQLEGFCYSIAHDLRGPLRAMAGFSAALLDGFSSELGEAGKDYLRRIVEAGQQMDRLIRDLLEYGRFNTVAFTPTRVNADKALSRVLQFLQPVIEEKKARIRRKGRLPDVCGHPVVLEAAFSNLIGNALKFVSAGVTPEVTIWSEETEQQVRIWIADNGIGIEPQFQRKIFEVFQRLHSQNSYPGTGIGLAIVKRAVQRIGGAVGVESEPGKGSRFWLALPAPNVA